MHLLWPLRPGFKRGRGGYSTFLFPASLAHASGEAGEEKKSEFILGQKRLGVRVPVISLGFVNLVLEIHVQSEKYSFLGLFRSLTLTELPWVKRCGVGS